MSTYLKSVRTPSLFVPSLHGKPVKRGQIILVKDDAVADKLLTRKEGEHNVWEKSTAEEYAAQSPAQAVAEKAPTPEPEAPAVADRALRLSSEGEESPEAKEASAVQLIATVQAVADAKPAEAPAAPVAKPKAVVAKRAAKPVQRKAK